jgi:predicted ATPase/transcriptional regulator with XRE-family HTH domain
MDTNNSARKKTVPNDRLREERERHSWTYKDVADQIELPDSRSVGRWERGISFPHARYRRELCRIFGKSLEELDLLRRPVDKDESQDDTEPSDVFYKLPVFFSSLIGREHDVLAASTMLMRQDVRLLTLRGTGGIGKTRLAIEVAAQVQEHFRDGACFVSLETLRDPSLVISSIADALGVHGRMGLSFVQQVKVFLRKKQILLLLDNFEHVVNASPVIEEILQECMHIKVLVTSRQVLDLQAEHVFDVPPLSRPDLNPLLNDVNNAANVENLMHYKAIALFVQRAQTLLPDFTITPSNTQVIAELCARLDGLPLAIELAVARIKVLSPQSLLERLSQDMDILKSDLRTVPERQRTLYRTIEWSCDLLNAPEKWLFWHLAVFTGGVTLKTIEAFFQSAPQRPPDLIEAVSSLLGKSLLQCLDQDSVERRFSMLETIRTYGLRCLQDNGELEESRRAFALYYLTVVEQGAVYLKGPQQFVWLKKLGRELDNLRTALHWLVERKETALALRFCEAFGKFCGLSGYWHEEQQSLDAVLALPHTSHMQAIRAKVLRRAGHLAYRMRDLVNAHMLLEESVRCSRELDDKQNLAGALGSLGRVLYRQDETILASNAFQESVELAYQSTDDWVIANALEGQGWFLLQQGDTSAAYALLEESVAISRKISDKESLARILTTLVELEITQSNMAQAALFAQESSRVALELGTGPLIALTFDTLGKVAMFQGVYEQAQRYIEERIAMAREFGDAPTVASRQIKLADIALAQGSPGQATRLVEEALAFLREQKDIPNIIKALGVLGDLKRFDGYLAQAKSFYQAALRLYKEPGDEKKFGRCLVGLAQIFLLEGQGEYAVTLLGTVEARLDPQRDMHPAQYTEYQRAKDGARTQLEEARFAQAWSQGRAASLEQILETFVWEEG